MKSFSILGILLLLMIILSSCDDEVFVFAGTINGNLNAEMQLIFNSDSTISGNFAYSEDKQSKIKVAGVLSGDSLSLQEFNSAQGTVTGFFDGKFKDGVYSGYWSNIKRTKKVPFSFHLNSFREENKDTSKIKYELFLKNEDMPFHHGLKAIVNGNEHILIYDTSQFESCIIYMYVFDFDDDGFEDVIIGEHVACGGNVSAAADISYITYNAKTKQFEGHYGFDTYFTDPIAEKWNDKWSIELDHHGEYGLFESKSRYIIENRKPKLVEHSEREQLKATRVLSVEEFDSQEDEDISDSDVYLYFDIDNDGKIDTIRAEVWDRWNFLQNIDVKFSNGQSVLKIEQARRIGILPNITKGVNDLVVDFDDVYKWNGKEFEKK